jgi:hypothetical protein
MEYPRLGALHQFDSLINDVGVDITDRYNIGPSLLESFQIATPLILHPYHPYGYSIVGSPSSTRDKQRCGCEPS